MDRKKSILNVAVSIGFKVLTLVMSIVVRKYLVEYCGNDVNGLNSLYISIIGFLAVAELGVGSAITFCMYKPIVENDTAQVSAIYQLFRRIYIVIGSFILISGLIISPFLHHLARDYAELDVNLQSTFILMLVSVVLTYGFGAKTSLINAYKNNYVATAINSTGILIQYVLQILVLVLYRSFHAYLVCRSISVALQWIATEFATRKKYAHVMVKGHKLNDEIKQTLVRSIRAMFMHNLGYVLVNSVDSIVISTFVGVGVLGMYSNYNTILTSMTGIIILAFSSLVSVVGHAYIKNSLEQSRRYCELFHSLNFILGTVFYLGYYAVIDDLIGLLFTAELVVDRTIVFVITLNGFVQYMRRSIIMFKDATGTFYNDRWKPLIEGIINVILSVVLVKLIGVSGVIVATIITCLGICHTVEPYVLYVNALNASPAKYFLKNYLMIAAFGAALYLLDRVMLNTGNMFTELLINGCIAMAIAAVLTAGLMALDRNLRTEAVRVIKKMTGRNKTT